jgi:hypothetical protein
LAARARLAVPGLRLKKPVAQVKPLGCNAALALKISFKKTSLLGGESIANYTFGSHQPLHSAAASGVLEISCRKLRIARKSNQKLLKHRGTEEAEE